MLIDNSISLVLSKISSGKGVNEVKNLGKYGDIMKKNKDEAKTDLNFSKYNNVKLLKLNVGREPKDNKCIFYLK